MAFTLRYFALEYKRGQAADPKDPQGAANVGFILP
jgi:hypothetical protein